MPYIKDLLQSLFMMASMVEARDPYTGGHLWRVSQFSGLLAKKAGLPSDEVARISVGGFLHDLGKIAIPDHILNKAGSLTDLEYEMMKTHPEVGSRLLSGHPLAELVRSAVLSHHETPIGTGYPHALRGNDLPTDARIISICDAFDAMTSTRPYRQAMPITQALNIIQREKGKQFDAHLATLWVSLGECGALQHIVGHSESGIPLQACPICGPTIVITRQHQHGNHVFCRHCGGESELSKSNGDIQVRPTGRKGTPRDLEPEADVDLINELVVLASHHLQHTL
ncbi:MAG: HD-GYP domain-containing protein [Mariprofundaceae bacterium]|nr:HD-GYP domain-containing protein [Mariprofundaceae bacterium]